MEPIFSVKPHTLSLLSCSSISPSLIIPRRNHRSLRNEFLSGSTRNLRLTGLRPRRRCRNTGFLFGTRSSRYVLKASIDSQAVVVVASFVTISALTIVFFGYSKKNANSNSNFKEISAELTLALRRQISDVMNWFPRHVFALLNVQEEKNVKTPAREVSKVSNECEDEGEDVQYGGTYLAHTLITNKVESPNANQMTSSSSVEASECNELTSDALAFTFPAETHNMHLQECPQGTEMTMEEVNSESRVALFPETNIDKRINEIKKTDPEIVDGLEKTHKLVADDEINIHNLIFRDSARKELYMFYEASTKILNGQATLTSHASLRGIGDFSPSSKVSAVQAGSVVEKRSHGCSKEGPFIKKDFEKRMNLLPEKEKSFSQDSSTKERVQIPKPKGIQVLEGRPDQFSAYRHILRDGRLMDCIEMLEDMERQGLLNMNKVYHAGFFQVCKSQKAVKEAFRFTRLIQNPTMSTFNMLLSVCASSQDLEGAFQVLQLVRETGLKADCKLYTTLISTCAKAGKVDTMFEL